MKALVLLLCLFASGTAQACRFTMPVKVQDVLKADAVVIAAVRGYRVAPESGRGAVLRIEPVEVLTGDLSPHAGHSGLVKVVWRGSGIGLPDPARFRPYRRENYVIALRLPPEDPVGGYCGPVAILQQPCSGPLVFSWKGSVGLMLRQVFQAPRAAKTGGARRSPVVCAADADAHRVRGRVSQPESLS